MGFQMENKKPEETIRTVVDACADCDVCRYLMDASCLMFPELYRLYDQETETGEKISDKALRGLVDRCNYCALCPCPNIREDIVRAKTQFIERDGLKFGVRTLADVERIGKVCGMFPGLINTLLGNRLTSGRLKALAGIHKDRRFPEIPEETFPRWSENRKQTIKPESAWKAKIAYFAGCTGRYLFPEVPKATVDVFEKNNIDIYCLEQKCCGMPTLLEGDKAQTLKFIRFNVDRLVEAVEDGYSIVCSCPTCGYMLKTVLKEGAYYSAEYQESVGADKNSIKVPSDSGAVNPSAKQFVHLKKSIYGDIFKDDGYFSTIDPRKRILVAENTFDVGEYLAGLQRTGQLDTRFGTVSANIAYYPPCHLREQNIGRPYPDLIGLIPGITIAAVDWSFYCCGMAGIMGFKKEFHDSSIRIGNRLIEKIKEINPDKLVTDCLSCRLQFNQLTPYTILHPLEILKESYDRY